MKSFFSFAMIFTAVAGCIFSIGLLFGMLQFPSASIELAAGATLMTISLILWTIPAFKKYNHAKALVLYTTFAWIAFVVAITLYLLQITAANPLLLLTLSTIVPIDIVWITIHILRQQPTDETQIHISK